jgi:DNA-binding NarL/FixJ family response regulator
MRILIADYQPLLLIGIGRALERDADFDVVGATHRGMEVVPLVGRLAPDVVLLGTRMPGLDGLDCLRRIRAQHPDVKVVMLSVEVEQEVVLAAFDLGACGYVVQTIALADLPSAIRQSVDGTVFHAYGASTLDEEAMAKSAGLTDRELAIMKNVARGRSNRAIAGDLWVTEQTVKFHLTNIYKKLEVTNRTEATRWAYDNGFVDEAAAAHRHAVVHL